MTNYLNILAPGALEYLTPLDIETIFTTTSAANNCEICLSFHAMTLMNEKVPTASVEAIVAGGVPKEPKLERLVVATKYLNAHKGILLPREKEHLAAYGFTAEELVEVNFVVGQMNGFNQLYVHLIAEGVNVEAFLQGAGPFKKTVYKAALDKSNKTDL